MFCLDGCKDVEIINNNIAGDVLGKNIVLLHSKKDILKKVDKELDIEMLK